MLDATPVERSTRHYPKLTEAEVADIIKALEAGQTISELSAQYGVDKRTVRKIKHGAIWDYMPRLKDFGPARRVIRPPLDQAACERVWVAYYTDGESASKVAVDQGLTENVVRQILHRRTHRKLTAHLKETFPKNARTNRRESPSKRRDTPLACVHCNKEFTPGATRRTTCSSECLTTMRQAKLLANRAKAKEVKGLGA